VPLGGQHLRALRESLGLRLIDVEEATAEIAQSLGNPEYSIPSSSLSDIEIKGITPTIYRLFALALIYRTDYSELLRFFGIDLSVELKLELPKPPATVPLKHPLLPAQLQIPILESEVDWTSTVHVGRMVQRWGVVAVSKLRDFAASDYIHGYVGSEDWTMYPLIPPGSFIQVDPEQRRVTTSKWNSELERPIYFLETRDEWICSWCSILEDRYLLIEPHPLSGVAPRRMVLNRDIEVLGTVVGVAMQLASPKTRPTPGGSRNAASNGVRDPALR